MTARSAPSASSAAPATFGAILLAGGRASRMGGVDKPRLVVDGMTMLDRAIAAVRGIGAQSIVAVGPDPGATAAAGPDASAATTTAAVPDGVVVPDPGTTVDPVADGRGETPVRWVREDPPFTGPAAAVVAGLNATAAERDPDWTFVLACDLPRVDAAVRLLRDDIFLLPSDTEGVCLTDASRRPQWLTAAYRTAALRRAAASVADAGRNQAMRVLLADVAIAAVDDRADSASDIDTWEDLRRFTKEDA